MKAGLTADRLREALRYEPDTGLFFRRVNSRRRPNTEVPAGGVNIPGYVVIFLDGKSYLAHRLAWLHVYGKWPEHDIDHINGERTDNRIANLRDIPQAINAQNIRRPPVSKATDLPLGVFVKPRLRKPYASRITVDGRSIWLGYFGTPEEAHAVYLAAKRRLHGGCTI